MRYAGLIEQARANNRQGFPIGAAYLRAANELAAFDVGVLRSVQESLRQRVNADLDRADSAGFWLHLAGWPLLAVLLAGGYWLMQRFRRLLNVALAAALLVAFGALAVGWVVQASAMSDAEDAIDGPLVAADLAAQARSAAFDARTHELLTLINRGNGAADEEAWGQSAAVAVLALTRLCDGGGECNLTEEFRQVIDAHDQLRSVDDGGDWESAKNVGLDPTGPTRTTFDQFVRDSGFTSDEQAAAAASALTDAPSSLAGMRVVVFLAGLVAAALALVGYGQRLREYR